MLLFLSIISVTLHQTQHSRCGSEGWVQGQDHPPQPAGNALPSVYVFVEFWMALLCPSFQPVEAVVRDSVRSCAEAKVDNIHCSSLIHSGSCFIAEGNVKHYLPSVKPCWLLLITFLPSVWIEKASRMRHSITFLKDQGSDDELVVPWVLLLALVDDLGDFGFLPVLRYLSWSPQPFKDDPELPCCGVLQLSQHPWMHPLRVHGSVSVELT